MISKSGIVMVAMVSPEEFKEIVHLKTELNDPEIKGALEESQKQHETGVVGTEQEIFKILHEKDTE